MYNDHSFKTSMAMPPVAWGPSMHGMMAGYADRIEELEAELRELRQHHAQQAAQPQMQPPTMIPMPFPMQVPHHGGGFNGGAQKSKEHEELLKAHQELLAVMQKQHETHTNLMKAHTDLMKVHAQALANPTNNKQGSGAAQQSSSKKEFPKLGVIRLDYDYPPAEGDIDSPASFGYKVVYRVVPGLTFQMAQDGKFTDKVRRRFAEGIKFLEQNGCSAITGDCGFMMAFQKTARQIATKPVFMSSMVQIPIIAASLDPGDHILILTANAQTLQPQKEVLLNDCGFDLDDQDNKRFIIIGCEDVDGFEAVAQGKKVPLAKVQKGITKKVHSELQKAPNIAGILLECTELPPYADALRACFGLPVWDAITGADFYINAYKDNPRFGLNDWQSAWDQQQEEYYFGKHLIDSDKKKVVQTSALAAKSSNKTKPSPDDDLRLKKKIAKKQAPKLGIIRLDYGYPPSAGDIDCPGSYSYDVIYRMVPGLTFEMAQAGKMSPEVRKEFVMGIKYLESKGACGITGDCGFMMAFQPLAREVAQVPVFMSSMVQCPMISVAFAKYDKILILTANSATLEPQKERLLNDCGFDVEDGRFVINGLQDVDGFNAVAEGKKVDVERVQPGVVRRTKALIEKQPTIRAILLECTELPPYADALRHATGLPVFDAITCADFFISATKDNPRFGMNEWQLPWDGEQDEYHLGQNLDAKERAAATHLEV